MHHHRPLLRIGWVLALTLASCRTAGGERPAAPAPSTTPAPAPDATPAWQRTLQAEVSALRGLPFKRPVGYGVQNLKDFRGFVREELDREMPAPKMKALASSYAQMGFLASGFDLRAALEEALTTQVAAYYDPRQQALRVLERKEARPAGAQPGDEIVAHELQHALQDQHFDLLAFDGEGSTPPLDEDERMARRFVTEGEAMFVMMAWQLGSGAGANRRLGPMAVAGLRMSVAVLSAGDFVDLFATLDGQPAAGISPEMRADVEALARLPPVIVSPLVDPYLKGALLVSETWARGGWPAVDELFRRPPQSTEQALHPVDKFLARRDPPVRIQAAPLPPELKTAAPLSSEVLGELGWRIYFKTVGQPGGEEAAAGWGGDRFWSWQVDGRAVVITATRWDSPADAGQFFDAYAASLTRRFPRGRATRPGPDQLRFLRPGGGLIAIERRGLDVDILDGPTATELPAWQGFARAASRR